MEIKNGKYEENGDIIYYSNNKIHRDNDLPAITRKDGSLEWWFNGLPHRENNPADIRKDGSKYWYFNGQKHRVGGPAVEKSDGTKIWRQYNEMHRLDGPAVEYADGTKEWWIDGKQYSEEDFNHIIEKKNLNKKLKLSLEIKPIIKKRKI